MTEHKIDNDGIGINVRVWLPTTAPKAVVVIQHGFNAHSGHYDWPAQQLTQAGYAVYAPDLRGRGKSDGERYYVESVDDYVSDLGVAFGLVREAHAGKPVFLLGHSAGGVVSCMYVLLHQAELAGFVCEDFAFQVPAPDFAIAALKGLSHVFPHAHVLRLKNEDFSRDPERVRMLNDDPLIANEVQPTNTIAELARADDRLRRSFAEIMLPVFILHGTGDKATKPEGSQFFYDHAGSEDKTLRLYDGYFHDPLADVGKERVMSDVLGWLDKHLR